LRSWPDGSPTAQLPDVQLRNYVTKPGANFGSSGGEELSRPYWEMRDDRFRMSPLISRGIFVKVKVMNEKRYGYR
jgi:hypothetical protein